MAWGQLARQARVYLAMVLPFQQLALALRAEPNSVRRRSETPSALGHSPKQMAHVQVQLRTQARAQTALALEQLVATAATPPLRLAWVLELHLRR